MERIGFIIASNRKRLSLTQNDLAKMLHVTPQAISKWENDMSEPDLATLRKLSGIFGISLDDFFSSNENNISNNQPQTSSKSDDVCVMCLGVGDNLKNTEQGLTCHSCLIELQFEDDKVNEILQTGISTLVKRGNSRKRSFITGAIIGAIMLVLLFASYPYKEGIPDMSFGEYLTSSLVVTFLATTLLSQLFYDSWQQEAMFRFTGVSMRMPGIIFELSIDGIIWLIMVKVLFGLITLLIGIVVFLFGLFINLIISPFTYFYELTKLIKEVRA